MRRFLLALALVTMVAQPTLGASVSFFLTTRPPTAPEIGAEPALAGMTVWNLFLTSSGDILSINEVTITLNGNSTGANLYQNANGSDVEPPNPLFVTVFPALGADSWITTPGATSSAGGGFSSAGATWFDSDNSGPQNQFQFARLTFPSNATSPYIAGIAGNVAIPSDDGLSVVNIPINFMPEPASTLLAGIGLVGLLATRRRRRG